MKDFWQTKKGIVRVIKKELLSFFRDKGFVITMFVGPLMIMAVFGYTFQADVRELKAIIVDEDRSKYSEEIKSAIGQSEYFAPVEFKGNLALAREKLRQSEVRAVFRIPPNFREDLDNTTQGKVELYLDSSDYTIYNLLNGASGEVVKNSLHDIIVMIIGDLEKERDQKKEELIQVQEMAKTADEKFQGIKDNIQASAEDRAGFYGQLKSIQEKVGQIDLNLKNLKKEFLAMAFEMDKQFEFGKISYFTYLTPAILSLILFFIGIIVTSINIVDERNLKTLYRVAVSPLGRVEFFAGKFIVFIIIGLVEVAYSLLIAILLFGVEVKGSLAAVALVLVLLIAASSGLGLLISTVVKTMRQASMLMPLIVIPAVLVSQTFSPIEVMPGYMRFISYLSPMYYSNFALRGIMIKGDSIFSLLAPVAILAIYAIITLSLGIRIYKKRIY